MAVQVGHRAKGKPRFYKDEIPAMTQDYGTGGQNMPIVVAETAYTKGNRKNSRVRLSGTASALDSGNSCAEAVPTVVRRSRTTEPYRISDVAPVLRQTDKQECRVSLDGQRLRRLTPIECERLQGWRDNHTALGRYLTSALPRSKRNGDEYTLQLVSDTQRYRMIGNGVTSDSVREIIKKMLLVECFR